METIIFYLNELLNWLNSPAKYTNLSAIIAALVWVRVMFRKGW